MVMTYGNIPADLKAGEPPRVLMTTHWTAPEVLFRFNESEFIIDDVCLEVDRERSTDYGKPDAFILSWWRKTPQGWAFHVKRLGKEEGQAAIGAGGTDPAIIRHIVGDSWPNYSIIVGNRS